MKAKRKGGKDLRRDGDIKAHQKTGIGNNTIKITTVSLKALLKKHICENCSHLPFLPTFMNDKPN